MRMDLSSSVKITKVDRGKCRFAVPERPPHFQPNGVKAAATDVTLRENGTRMSMTRCTYRDSSRSNRWPPKHQILAGATSFR
jgi:hypothetical protein